tara:strand:+ start:779 stop:1051 length:273 start_codon:yes stop_codon:yes gene_type:complete
MVFLNITSFLGDLGDNPENIFKISRKKILFIFCIFVLYKVISISLDLTFKYLQIALQIIFVGFQVECSSSIGPGDPESNKFILNCKYIFK